jgi:hypothetical protein
MLPFAESAIWPLLDDPSLEVETEDFRAMSGLLYCPPTIPACASVKKAARAGLLLFVLGHELNHAARRDQRPSDGRYPIEIEKAADKKALGVLAQVASESGATMSRPQELALYTGPVMALTLEESATQNANDRQILSQRRDAVIAQVPPLLRARVVKLVGPTSTRTGSTRLRVQVSEVPDTIWVKGVRAVPTELQHDWTVLVGSYPIVAWTRSALACTIADLAEGRDTRISLTFGKIPSTEVPSEAGLDQLAEAADWCAILRAVAGSSGAPREAKFDAWWTLARRKLLVADQAVPVPLQFLNPTNNRGSSVF